MLVTNKDIEYQAAPYHGIIATIPKGTPVTLATNIDSTDEYWVGRWEGMSDIAMSWKRNYGFLVSDEDVTKG